MNTKEVSKRYGVCFSACSKWAKENDVDRIQIKGILAYNWTENDCLRFELRSGKGWKKGVLRKIKNSL